MVLHSTYYYSSSPIYTYIYTLPRTSIFLASLSRWHPQCLCSIYSPQRQRNVCSSGALTMIVMRWCYVVCVVPHCITSYEQKIIYMWTVRSVIHIYIYKQAHFLPPKTNTWVNVSKEWVQKWSWKVFRNYFSFPCFSFLLTAVIISSTTSQHTHKHIHTGFDILRYITLTNAPGFLYVCLDLYVHLTGARKCLVCLLSSSFFLSRHFVLYMYTSFFIWDLWACIVQYVFGFMWKSL